jgi:molecular chaperone DnaJ
MKKARKISVKIPPGVEEGSHMRLKGEGEASPNGGPPGDLYVQIHIAPHQYFTREGDDLIYDLHLDYPQVALGTEASIPTIDGTTKVNIRAGTQPGEIIKLKGKGMPRLYGYGSGDLLVRVNVSVPQKLTPKQRELLEQLAKEFGQEVKPNRKRFHF